MTPTAETVALAAELARARDLARSMGEASTRVLLAATTAAIAELVGIPVDAFTCTACDLTGAAGFDFACPQCPAVKLPRQIRGAVPKAGA